MGAKMHKKGRKAAELPPGISAEELAAYEQRVAAREQSNHVPLPGPALEAFLPTTRVVEGFTLLPVTAGHVAILQKIDSPLIRAAARMLSEKGRKPAPDENVPLEDVLETFFVFTKQPPELRALLAKGRQAFREGAMAAIGDKLRPGQIEALPEAIGLHFAASFATAVEYQAVDTGGGGGFPKPPAEP